MLWTHPPSPSPQPFLYLPYVQSFKFLFDIPEYVNARMPQKTAAGIWRQGIQQEISSAQLSLQLQKTAIYFIENHVNRGDRIILYADKFSIDWLIIDMAIMSVGAISVPITFPIRESELAPMLSRIQPTLIIRTSTTDKWKTEINEVLLESFSLHDTSITDDALVVLKNIRDQISPDDIATIVHTSGSSGEPRAVALSHQNVVSNLLAVLSFVPFVPGTRVISFLPLSHIFERIVCYVYLASGANIYFLDSYRYALWALKDVRPEYFTSVPLVLERFASVLEDRVEESDWFTRWAYKSWDKTKKGLVSHVGSIIAHQWIIKRWKKKMGGKIKGIISGAAYLDPKVEKLYDRSGIEVLQGYGLTEASPVVTMNRHEPGGHRGGTVGQPIPGVEVKIMDDGEILVKGPNVMKGYYKDEEATAHVVKDGWLHTGDIGRWEKDRFLVITDRKSNIYKHASGKFISPAHVESTLMQLSLISQVMIIGFKRPFTIALIIPDFEALQKKCDELNIHWTSPQYMVHNTKVIELYRYALDHAGLPSHERIEKFILLDDTWSVENGLLTATYKPRRGEIEKMYGKEIDALYQ